MNTPYFQEWKFITVVMKEATNQGIGKASPTDPFNSVKGDKRFLGVTLNEDGLGEIISANNKSDVVFMGILMESFNKPMIPTKVLTHGVAPMKCAENITLTDKTVGLSREVGKSGQIKTLVYGGADAPTDIPVGLALHPGKVGEYVPVLVGMI